MFPSPKLTKKLLIFLLAAVLALGIASAAGFTSSIKAVNADIVEFSGSYATYTLTIKNNAGVPKTFGIRTLDSLDWTIEVQPSTNNFVELSAGEEGVYLLRVSETPREGRFVKQIGTYTLSLIIESGEDKVTEPVYISLVSQERLNRNYPPDIIATAELSVLKVDPRVKPTARVFLRNLNLRSNEKIDITISSQQNLFYQTGTVSLGPLEEKIVDFTLNLKSDESPKKDRMVVSVQTFGDDGQAYPKKQPDPIEYEIIPYSTIIRDTQVEEQFLKTTTKIIAFNDGNIRQEVEIKQESSFFQRLFTTTIPKAEFTREGSSYFYAWKVNLESTQDGKPQESTYTIINNYRPLLVLFIALIAMIVFYYLYRSPIVMRKDVTKILTKEGGIAGLKIIIHIKNRSNRTVENIKILDKIPTIAELEKNFEVGTLKPSSIEKKGHSTNVSWDIANLEPFEERMVTYHIKSKLSVLGGFNLKRAIARFTKINGKEVIVTSNSIDLSKRLIE